MPLTGNTGSRGPWPGEKATRWRTVRLYLLVQPSGGKLWRLRYRVRKGKSCWPWGLPRMSPSRWRGSAGTRSPPAPGGWGDPANTPQGPQGGHEEARATASKPLPGRVVLQDAADRAPSHADKILRRLERDVFPDWQQSPLPTLPPLTCWTVARRIPKPSAPSKRPTAPLQNCGQVFRYAVATGRERDLRASAGAPCPDREAMAAITDPAEVAGLLRGYRCLPGTLTVKSALQLAPLVFVRPGELRKAEWAEIDLETRVNGTSRPNG